MGRKIQKLTKWTFSSNLVILPGGLAQWSYPPPQKVRVLIPIGDYVLKSHTNVSVNLNRPKINLLCFYY
jgi:hypothetical protein